MQQAATERLEDLKTVVRELSDLCGSLKREFDAAERKGDAIHAAALHDHRKKALRAFKALTDYGGKASMAGVDLDVMRELATYAAPFKTQRST
jgi:hypothetical protein